MSSTTYHHSTVTQQNWFAVLGLSLGAFSLIASEFMPVSILTPIAADLHSSEGQAGLAITFSGAFALVTSLFITSIAGRMDRKHLLLLLTLLVIISGTIVALASSFSVFMLGRALIGIAIGGFWSMSAATAMRLVSKENIPRALAIVNGGNALASVVAAPLGSYLGGLIGWRGAFFCVVPVAVLTFFWLLFSLPAMKATSHIASKSVFSLLKRKRVAIGIAAASAFFMGQFTLFTYLRPFLELVTQVDVTGLSIILLVMGVSGIVGTMMIGAVIKHWLYHTLIITPLLMAAIALALTVFGNSYAVAMILLGLWGLVATAAPVAWWTWLAQTLPDDAEAGGGLLVGIVQLAIASGATLGGIFFDLQGYQATFGLSISVLMIAAALAYWVSKAD